MKLSCVQWVAIVLGPVLALVILVAHYLWADITGSGTEFQRGGALVVLVEVLLFSMVRSKLLSENSQAWIGGRPVLKLDTASTVISGTVATVATLTWGYGELIYDLLQGQ